MTRKRANIHLHNDLPGNEISLKQYKPVIDRVLVERRLAVNELSVILVDDEYLRKLHSKYLNDSSYTDVMTFNLNPGGEIEAEIYISFDRAKIQARQYGVPVTNEIARLIFHGLLHLEGYDDATEAEREKMHRLENELLKKYWAG